MDGSNAGFLFEAPLSSPTGGTAARGILYVEDFDADPVPVETVAEHAAVAQHFSAEELAAAHAMGRQEGLAAALTDSRLMQAQLELAATQALADGLTASRACLDNVADRHATEVTRTILAILQAAVPVTMRNHASGELQGMFEALSRGLACEPELRVRAHPDLADFVRETLIRLLPDERCILSVCADAALGPGDVIVAWQDGHARRDCAQIWAAISAALAPLGLPKLKDIDHAG